MKIACFTDIHNQQCMLNMPTVLRTSAIKAANQTIDEFGKVDLSIMGGDYFSDYPYWNKSCALPKENWEDIKSKMVKTFAETANGEKVLYVSGNNDLMLGDLPTKNNAPYNTCDFYLSGPMKDTIGYITDEECYKRYSTKKGKKAGCYYLAFHYVIDNVDFFGLNIDPDEGYNNHDCTFDYNALIWLEKKLNAVDPNGNKLIFVVGHSSFTVRQTSGNIKNSNIDTKRVNAIKEAFNGHRNLFYLYGHVHGQNYLRSETWQGILNFDKDFNVIPNDNMNAFNPTDNNANFHTVHMGGLRPFVTKIPFEYFENDGLFGIVPGDIEEKFYEATGTPKIAQYLIIETFYDRIVFSYRNVGSLTGYTKNDKPEPYTVFLAK